MEGPSRVDASDTRIGAAAAVVHLTLIDVGTVEPVPCIPGRTVSTHKRTRKVDTLHRRVHRTMRLRCRTLINVNRTGWRYSISGPSLITNAFITGRFVGVHTRSRSTQVTAAQTIGRPLRTVQPEKSGRTLATVIARSVNAGGAILAAQIGAGKMGAFVNVSFAGGTLPIHRTQAHITFVLVDAGAGVLARIVGAVVLEQLGFKAAHFPLDGIYALIQGEHSQARSGSVPGCVIHTGAARRSKV